MFCRDTQLRRVHRVGGKAGGLQLRMQRKEGGVGGEWRAGDSVLGCIRRGMASRGRRLLQPPVHINGHL